MTGFDGRIIVLAAIIASASTAYGQQPSTAPSDASSWAQEEHALREAGKRVPPAELDKIISEIKARRHPDLLTKPQQMRLVVTRALEKTVIQLLKVAVILLIITCALTAFWALKNKEFLTLATFVFSINPLLIGIQRISAPSDTVFIGTLLVFLGISIPVIFKAVTLTSETMIFDSLITVVVILSIATFATRNGAVYIVTCGALAFCILWGLGHALIYFREKRNVEAAHCLAYASAMSTIGVSALALSLVGM